ncbi:MAG: WYL domain-containing protein [Phycisphaerales bacterium]|nr:WYL domain-containing protein [Phycisphaerales bacterium]
MAKTKIARHEAVSIIIKLLMDAGDCGKWISLKVLTHAINRDARTVKRMLSDMKSGGAKILNKRDHGYQMTSPPSGAALAPLIPDDLLVVLRKLAASLAGTPWHAKLDQLLGKQVDELRARAKSANSTKESRIERLTKVLFIADFELPAAVDGEPENLQYNYNSNSLQEKWLMMLQAAIDQRVISVKYRSVKGTTTSNETRELLPLHIFIRHGGVYAMCQDLLSKNPEQIKSFALHRLEINPRVPKPHESEHPTEQRTVQAKSIDLRARMEHAVGGMPDDNKAFEVELVYRDLPQDTPYYALNMGLGEIWTKRQTQRIRNIKNKSSHSSSSRSEDAPATTELHVNFTTSSKIETVRRVLAYGGRVVLLKPESWLREINAAAKALALAHSH